MEVNNKTPTANILSVLTQIPEERFLDCIHCGLCLNSCPTYVLTGLEADSPRGRIYFMRALRDRRLEPDPAVMEHLDRCLDCRACETSCPSGVQYGTMIETARQVTRVLAKRSPGEKVLRKVVFEYILAHPAVFKAALLPLRIISGLGLMRFIRKLPGTLGRMVNLIPDHWGQKNKLSGNSLETQRPSTDGNESKPVPRAGMLLGCVMEVLYPRVNQATARVLDRFGYETFTPSDQGCCGAIHLHSGDPQTAKAMAKKNIEAFERQGWPEVIVSNAAGCGLVMKEYSHLLADEKDWKERAENFSRRVKDILEIAVLKMPQNLASVSGTATYHDPCHLAHGQGIRSEARTVLASIPGLDLKEMSESDWCCGAAGTYNLTQPELSDSLLERKISCIEHTGAERVIAGNPPCMAQIEMGLRHKNSNTKVYHPVEILDQALRGSSGESNPSHG